MADFFDMGGYALWVWAAYGLSALALIGLGLSSVRANTAARNKVESLRPRRRKEG